MSRPSSVFIAAPFTVASTRLVSAVFVPAIRGQGLTPVRIVRYNDNSAALWEIERQIAECKAVVGLLLGRGRNVLIEIGIAIGMQKPVVLVASSAASLGMLLGPYPSVQLRPGDLATAAARCDLSRRIGQQLRHLRHPPPVRRRGRFDLSYPSYR